MRQNALERDLKEKADKTDMDEMKKDVKEVLSHISELKVDNARWQGLMEQALSSKHERS